MAHVVNTSVAAVKMSGTFATFSSSEDEGEDEKEENVRRPRSNAVLESIPSKRDPESSVMTKNGNVLSNVSTDTVSRLTSIVPEFSQTQAVSPATSESESRSQKQRIDSDCTVQSEIYPDTKPLVASYVGTESTTQPRLQNDMNTNGDIVASIRTPRDTGCVKIQNRASSSETYSSSSSPVTVNRKSMPVTNGTVSSASGASSGSSSMRDMYNHSRFNPFDRDIYLEEDHFSDNQDGNFFSRNSSSPVSRDTLSSQSSDHWTDSNVLAEDNSTITNAELGLAEDHFSHPEGHFGLTQAEELESAIENCKDLIIQAVPTSDRQTALVRKLIQLRMKLQDLKDEPAVAEENVLTVLGHRFLRKEGRSSKYYCEKCNSLIWGVVQEWRKCLDCGYRCHEKCVSVITRNCAMMKVKKNPSFILQICPRNPKGLQAQDYRCAECRALIPVADGVEPRLCEYNGRYYCEMCHWNDLMYIPAQILLNWDFEKQKVCRASKQFLKLMMKKAVINVQAVNSSLFNYVEQLNDIRTLREELLLMKKYILACPAAMGAKLLLQLSSRPHFVECADRYSLQDLLDSDDALIPELVQVHSSWAQHIKTDCQLCQGRGFYCELCTSQEVLFPFDNVAVVCPSCSAVMHRICFAQKVMCPKCERRRKRQDSGNGS